MPRSKSIAGVTASLAATAALGAAGPAAACDNPPDQPSARQSDQTHVRGAEARSWKHGRAHGWWKHDRRTVSREESD